MPDIDYQEMITVIAIIIKFATPIGVIFAVGEWSITFFFECAFPKFFKRRD